MKSAAPALVSVNQESCTEWFCQRFSKYENMVRLVGWISRFILNRLSIKENRNTGELTASEFGRAELIFFRIVRKETFQGEDDKKVKFLSVYKDEDGFLRVKTKITYRKDTDNSRKPVLLPSEHGVVSRWIRFHHEKNSHCGVQTLINILRETYWILRGRNSV
ncbi:hypothetical protein AVEN_18659-1 [Araneus ventricosus]|uniref:Integrase zinc-binding domain-containing protein n=1 Tax=Araneus ventricosus TaxID=182803 RepID=A0A4Y2RPV1_ARAVE|nr:hypothetical protein AVEN_18659-1 [Araneus ventricosus]